MSMRKETGIIIEKFQIWKKGFDFMGYDVNTLESLDFHHVFIPNCIFAAAGHVNEGYKEWNGVVLVHNTSHKYLHVVEKYDPERFMDITSEIIDQKIKCRLDPDNIRYIDMILTEFERQWKGEKGYNNELIVQEEFTKRLSRVRFR